MGLLADGFQRRAKLTIPAAQVGSGGVSNYSVVLTEGCIGSSHSFWSEVQSNGGDLRASTDVNGDTRLALDIIHLDTSAKTAEINLGQVSLSSVSNNEFYLWWKHGTTQSQPAVGASFGQYATYESANVARWDMGLTSGAVNDRTSNANHGTRLGSGGTNNLPQETTGKVRKALDFDGTDDCVQVTSQVTAGADATYAAWLYAPSTSGDRTVFGSTGTGTSYILLWYRVGGNWYIFVGNATPGTQVYWIIGGTQANWLHMLLTKVGSTLELFLDGVSQGTATMTGISPVDFIGRGQSGANNYYWKGLIDDVRIYSRAITATEILTNYNNTNSPGTFATLASADVLGGGSNRRGIRTGGNLTAGGILIGGRL